MLPADDICRTVIEITEEVNVGKFVDFSHRNSHGYDGVMMFKLVVLAKAEMGYVSTRELERLCKTDIRYMFIAQNQKPSHMAFYRFIHDDLTMPIEDIFVEINKYFKKQNINLRYSILKHPSIDYLLDISDKLEKCMQYQGISFVHGKGIRKSDGVHESQSKQLELLVQIMYKNIVYYYSYPSIYTSFEFLKKILTIGSKLHN